MSSLSKSFSDVLTFTATGNRTMVDSDGVLKWAPHNLLTYSEQFDNADWSKPDATVTVNAATAPDGTVTADKLVEDSGSVVAPRVLQSPTVAGSSEYTQGVWVKSAGDDRGVRLTLGGSGFNTTSGFFNPDTGTITSGSFDVTDFGDGWYFLSFSNNTTSSGGSSTVAITLTEAADSETLIYTGDGTSGIYIWGAHLYRSDLGGMVNNPDRGDSYVPTTSSAVFLPRRGHHVWDGSQWVNKGLLLESESRTNLVTKSQITDAEWGTGASGVAISISDNALSAIGLSFAKAEASSGVSFHHCARTFSVAASALPYSLSVFVKDDTAGFASLTVTGGGPALNASYVFDLSDGSIAQTLSAGDATPIVESMGNGIFRISITDTTNGTSGNPQFKVGPHDGGATESWSASGGESIYVAAAQAEQASTPSSYIPTSGSTVTRAGETLTAPSDNLPWPEPVVIGEELVTNGTFDSDLSGWTDDSNGWAYDSGRAYHAPSSDFQTLRQSLNLTAGKVYLITFDYEVVSGQLRCQSRTDANLPESSLNLADITGTGSTSAIFVATSDLDNIAFARHTIGVSSEFYIDNVSVREINPLAVSIAMEGGETFADLDTAGQVALYDRRVDANNRITLTLDTDGAKTGTFTLTLVNGGSSETISTTGEIAPDVNEPFNVAFVATSNELGIALNGTAETRVSHSLGLPDLSTVDATYEGMGTRAVVREWADDITNAGKEVATS